MKHGKASVLLAAWSAAVLLAGCGASGGENLQQGMGQIEQMDYEGALTSFEAAMVNKENLRQVYRGQGLAYMGLTNYENAAASLEKALALGGPVPDQLDFDINYYLATAYYKGGQVQKAIGVYSAITDLRPQEKDAWYLKGTMELELGQQEQAKADFDRAVQTDGDDYDMRIDIFCSCSKYGYGELGSPYLEEVVADDSLRLSDYDRGRIQFYLGNYEEAKTCLESAQGSGGADVASLLGQTYEKLGDYNYAASVYSSYLETSQADAQIYNQLGLCRLQTGDYEAALNAFEAGIAVEGNPVMQSLRFNQIVAYEYLGQFDQATLAMEQYPALYPDDEKAQREYTFLKTR